MKYKNYIINTFRHFKKVCTHKHWVFYYCCKVGIPFQGLVHDLSKFSPTEFWESVKYYQGTSSPIDACKKENGWSAAWMHHKGRNKHHYEYWQDNFDNGGNPIEWGEKMINHYESLGINPKTKTLLFSDSLDFERADKLFRHFHDRVNVAFGIGTYLSNDTDVPVLNIVMKTTKCNGMDVAKVSDVEGKGMCKNPDYVDYLKRCINWRMNHE